LCCKNKSDFNGVKAIMTRETRIGLLVGLLFIVMFGLVLSELTGSSRPAQATAIAPNSGGAEDVQSFLWQPAPPEGRRPAPTAGAEGAAPTAAIVRASPDDAGRVEVALARPTETASAIAAAESALPVGGSHITPAVATTSAAAPLRELARAEAPAQTYKVQPNDSLMKIARKVYGPQHELEYKRIYDANRDKLRDERSLSVGTELVIPALPGAAPAAPAPSSPLRTAPRGAEGVRTASSDGSAGATARDVAAAGRRAMGAGPLADLSPRAEDDAPALSTTSAAVAGTARGGVAVSGTAARTGSATDEPRGALAGTSDSRLALTPPTAAKLYTVKKGDCLAKIAREMLDSSSKSAIDKILAANKDKLHNADELQIGMVLSMPQ
jgi:nucleoid-associated protein YgaU